MNTNAATETTLAGVVGGIEKHKSIPAARSLPTLTEADKQLGAHSEDGR